MRVPVGGHRGDACERQQGVEFRRRLGDAVTVVDVGDDAEVLSRKGKGTKGDMFEILTDL